MTGDRAAVLTDSLMRSSRRIFVEACSMTAEGVVNTIWRLVSVFFLGEKSGDWDNLGLALTSTLDKDNRGRVDGLNVNVNADAWWRLLFSFGRMRIKMRMKQCIKKVFCMKDEEHLLLSFLLIGLSIIGWLTRD